MSMRKFHRKKDQRRAFMNALANNLILKEKIKTTKARAKELSGFIGRLVSRAKKDNLSSVRYLVRLLNDKARKKIKTIALRYKDRAGGYTRIIHLGPRKSDGAQMSIIEFV